MSEHRISLVVYELDMFGNQHMVDYTPAWKNIIDHIDNTIGEHPLWQNSARFLLKQEYNAYLDANDIVFENREDAMRFILEWS
jgi:hypothetical protein